MLRFKIAAMAMLCLAAAGCANVPQSDIGGAAPMSESGQIRTPPAPLQCVAYARGRSGLAIYGDAATWWDQAADRYVRGSRPAEGAVLVLHGYAGPDRAHLAVVRSVVSSRIIHVDHANWLNRGQIYLDDPVVDVSPDNDWSVVRVFNLRTGSWGIRDYPVQGFIGPGQPSMRLAHAPSATDSLDIPID